MITFFTPKLDEIGNIIENTKLEHDIKHGSSRFSKIEVKSNVKFLDRMKNKKNITINSCCVKRGIIKTKASQGLYKFVRLNRLSSLLEGNIYKNVIQTYMKCNNTPKLWRIFL